MSMYVVFVGHLKQCHTIRQQSFKHFIGGQSGICTRTLQFKRLLSYCYTICPFHFAAPQHLQTYYFYAGAISCTATEKLVEREGLAPPVGFRHRLKRPLKSLLINRSKFSRLTRSGASFELNLDNVNFQVGYFVGR